MMLSMSMAVNNAPLLGTTGSIVGSMKSAGLEEAQLLAVTATPACVRRGLRAFSVFSTSLGVPAATSRGRGDLIVAAWTPAGDNFAGELNLIAAEMPCSDAFDPAADVGVATAMASEDSRT
jgi:hypothetical protein